ncbi:uncharacterized protein SOCE26_088620 [Sorangium cellulosum]|uniref:ATP-grasp domain-containing protein n=1 Tax=Sorangium cellulosum TaxID=56 RepID=A0A2L0F728_SORCE|nr:hypothetical protein [Sorangium cellulosum]AUX47343.1 uncharacterized protein SOCE26_088620 [Sorangium cellulosum]
MSGSPLRIAMFPRGIDGLFLPPARGVELLALVARGAPEEAWARRVLGDERVLPYDLSRSDLGVYPATEDLLMHSDIHEVMASSGTRGLFLSSSCTRGTRAWATRHGVRLIATEYTHQRRFEDKIWFDRFLVRHGLPRPAGGPVTFGSAERWPVQGPAVVQEPSSLGGEGTYFVRGPEDLDALARRGALARGSRYLVRELVDGSPYGITVFVTPAVVALSTVRLQCYYPHEATGGAHGHHHVFAGVQWIPTPDLPEELRRQLDAIFLKLGDLLHARRFFGFANVDFMVDTRGRVLLLECNPRMSAATPQLLARPELLSGVAAGALFLEAFLGERTPAPPGTPARSPLPAASYRGATLDIVSAPRAPADGARAAVVRRGFETGLYALEERGVRHLGPDVRQLPGDRELALFSYARPGQPCPPETTLASAVSNLPLYGPRGELLAPARELLEYFDYTDDRQGIRREETPG